MLVETNLSLNMGAIDTFVASTGSITALMQVVDVSVLKSAKDVTKENHPSLIKENTLSGWSISLEMRVGLSGVKRIQTR